MPLFRPPQPCSLINFEAKVYRNFAIVLIWVIVEAASKAVAVKYIRRKFQVNEKPRGSYVLFTHVFVGQKCRSDSLGLNPSID